MLNNCFHIEGGIVLLDQAGIMMAQGSSIACERISGVNDNMHQNHYHEYYEIYFLESGERYHILHDSKYAMQPGELILFSPYVLHRSYGDQNVPFKRLVLYFSASQIDSPQLKDALDHGNGLYRPEAKNQKEIHDLLQTLLNEQDDSSVFRSGYMHTLLNMLLFSIMLQVHKEEPAKKEQFDRMRQVISYIHTHYQEDISLEQLAKIFYISPYYLCREFKRHMDCTMVQYLNVTRIMNAQRKLVETDLNITQVSQETGFSNLTHFNRVFKSVTGMTPSGYQKHIRK